MAIELEKQITIVDGEGKEHLMEILFTYENEERGKSYVFLYEKDDEENVLAFIYNEEDKSLSEIEDDEAWRIHDAIKRLVIHQRVPEICSYLKELKQKGKVMLPPSSTVMYNELVRLGMSTGEGYSEKHFNNSYLK